jgi:anaerobic selenocysteine-containing dehydrogenase
MATSRVPAATGAETSRIVLGTCHHDCPDSCGWQVTVNGDGVATQLRGNPEHPYSQGELCPKVNRFLERVYHPDRILTPLVRTGTKGSGEFRPASWDEALQLVASRVGTIVDTHGGEAVWPWSSAGTQSTIMLSSLDRRFFARLGASRSVDSLCGATARNATASALGSPLVSDPLDVQHSKFVILWGTNTRLTNRHLWPFIEKARTNGAKIVVIDPVRTITADAADDFFQIAPGTDVALMLAMMHVIFSADLADRDYLQRYTTGADELERHVEQLTPEWAAQHTGIAADRIRQLARSYATVRPAFIRTLIGAEHRHHGGQFFRTISLLPAIVGSWREVGGGYARSSGSWFSSVVDDSAFDEVRFEVAPRRSLSVNRIGENLTRTDLEPRVHALFVWNGNPLATAPDATATRRGLEREDLFTVVSEQFLTDTALYADVIFPACTHIEYDDVVTAWGHLYLGFNNKAIEPVGESVPNTELWRRLARAMGFTEPELFESDESLLASCMPTLDVDDLRRRGVIRLPLPDPLLPYVEGNFATDDGKVHLANAELEDAAHGRLPTYTPPPLPTAHTSDSADAPLVLMSPKKHVRFLNTSYTPLDAHAVPEGEQLCEMTPRDARARGINDGDWVRVHNERGSVTLRARVDDDVRVQDGMVSIPFGWTLTRTADAQTVNMLTCAAPADWGGGVAFYDTVVRIERTDEPPRAARLNA